MKPYEADSNFSILAPSKEPTIENSDLNSDFFNANNTKVYEWDDNYDNSESGFFKMKINLYKYDKQLFLMQIMVYMIICIRRMELKKQTRLLAI